MYKMNYLMKLLVVVLVLGGFTKAFADTEVTGLICEYHTNPIGIDVQQPRLSWKIVSDEKNLMQSAYQIRVADSPSNLKRKNKLVWDSEKIESNESVQIEYTGPEPESMERYYWQVRVWYGDGKSTKWSEPAYWEMGILEPEKWEASWITFPDEPAADGGSLPGHHYRNEFSTSKKISSARAYVTAHGLYELYINGKKVGDELFTPGWTSYNKRLQYQTFDVTDLLQNENTVAAVLGDGWYRGNIGWKDQDGYYGKKLALLAQIVIDYSDGSSEIITTNSDWKVSNNGPILESDIYNGEIYDATKEMEGWKTNGFDDNVWKNAETAGHSKELLIAPQGVPVKAIEEITPIELITTPKGEVVFDMGQNMVGWVRMKVSGEKGDTVKLKFAEVLDKEGNFYTANLRSAKATDTYILSGESEEVYEPTFTFHGFRYVQLINYPGTPKPEDFTGVVIHSEMDPTGTFVTSDSLINQLQHNIQWGQKGNFLDVPTDCPQRDERLGWTGDAQVFAPTAAYNFDVAAFYTKWLGDVAADQLEDGKVPHVVPDVLQGASGATAWADAAIIVPWTNYLSYGDRRILDDQYSSMKKWVEFMRKRAGDSYLWTGDQHFGDWLAFATTRSDYPGATTEKDLIATAYYAYSSGLLSKIAGILGKEDDAREYAQLSEKVKEAFINEFVTPSGRLVSHTQTAYSLALAFDLLPENLIPNAAKYLADDVKKMGHLTTGFVGTPLLCNTLSEQGYEDLAFMLLNRKEYPSWLYPVTQGATTIWERWDGQKPDGSFQNVGMNSFNHYAYGAIGEWLYNYVAGIQIDVENPGYKHFKLAPHPGGGLSFAKATYDSMYGKILSHWRIKDEMLVYEIEIPANTTATVTLPEAVKSGVSMNGSPLRDELNAEQLEKGVQFKLGSGHYLFNYPL